MRRTFLSLAIALAPFAAAPPVQALFEARVCDTLQAINPLQQQAFAHKHQNSYYFEHSFLAAL